MQEGRCEGRWVAMYTGWVDVSAGARCECRYESRRVDECRTSRWVDGLLGLPMGNSFFLSFLFFSY